MRWVAQTQVFPQSIDIPQRCTYWTVASAIGMWLLDCSVDHPQLSAYAPMDTSCVCARTERVHPYATASMQTTDMGSPSGQPLFVGTGMLVWWPIAQTLCNLSWDSLHWVRRVISMPIFPSIFMGIFLLIVLKHLRRSREHPEVGLWSRMACSNWY